ncbi:MAG: hypothetical protein AAF196_16535, partial [Planctomycetota bacterium]
SLRTVQGGVFLFRDLVIPSGVTVRGEGSNPLVIVCTRDCVIRGALRVDGADGSRVDTLNSANFPSPGGRGQCGGGDGGDGSPFLARRSPAGLSGRGGSAFFLRPGGAGGELVINGGRAPGGGGGSFITNGDPYYPFSSTAPRWTQLSGQGGAGGLGLAGALTRVPDGGVPNGSPFLNQIQVDDFFGVGVDLSLGLVIPGELSELTGGTGGGGGGDLSGGGLQFVTDEKGGGGGAGGGALLIAAVNSIVLDGGQISADGGNGGGGEQAGGNNRGGGGGGGSGGMIVLASTGIVDLRMSEFDSTGGPLASDGDYVFSLSAQGGIGTQGDFTRAIDGKYGASGNTVGDPSWDDFPAGGFGGLGLIQIVTPPGQNADGTNTILDDSIVVRDPAGNILSGAMKQAALSWRGFPRAGGDGVDDQGNAIQLGVQVGDIHPPPLLQPILN